MNVWSSAIGPTTRGRFSTRFLCRGTQDIGGSPMSLVLPGDPRCVNDPCLVWDNRQALQAQNKAGLHVLLAGISNYPHLPGPNEPLTAAGLGMRRLSSTSLSTYLVLDWLVRAEQAHQLH